MPLWANGDLIVALDGPVASPGTLAPVLGVWELPSGTYKGAVSLSPPLDGSTARAPGLGRPTPDNGLVWGHFLVTDATYDHQFVTNNGANGNLTADRSWATSLQPGIDLDLAGNRYIGDWNSSDHFHIRKIPLVGGEVIYPWDDTGGDPNINTGAQIDMNTLRVNGAGTRAYWNSISIDPDQTGWNGWNRFDLANNLSLPWFDLTTLVADIDNNSVGDFVTGYVTERIYVTATRDSFVPHVFVVDPLTDTLVTSWAVGGSIICFAGGIAVNCDESLVAVEHLDVGGDEDIEVYQSDGTHVLTIDYIGDSGYTTYRGLCFANCPEGGGGSVFPGIAKVPRVGTVQEWFFPTTPGA